MHAAVRTFVATVAVAVASNAPAQDTRPPAKEGFVDIGGGARIYYAVHGSAADTVIVPLGMLISAQLMPLAEHFTLVFYDPRGRGRSDWIHDGRRLTMADELRDIETLRRHLGISRVALIGFSYAGLVAALYAAELPNTVTRVVQLAPMPVDEVTRARYVPPERRERTDSANASLARLRAAATDTTDAAAECRRWYQAHAPLYVGDPADAERVPTSFCAFENETPARFQWRVDQTFRSMGRDWDHSRRAALIRAPTLVIQGDRDLITPPDGARRWAELIPDARLIMLSGAGHLLHVERRDRLLSVLIRFLGGSWPPEAMRVRSGR